MQQVIGTTPAFKPRPQSTRQAPLSRGYTPPAPNLATRLEGIARRLQRRARALFDRKARYTEAQVAEAFLGGVILAAAIFYPF